MKVSSKANLILLLVTLIWGLTFPLIHLAMQIISPELFVAVRFLLAGLLFFPLVIKYNFRQHQKVFLAGLIIGLLSGLSYLFQTEGMVTIAASRSAFITGMSVVLVPLCMPFFRLGWPKIIDYASIILCLLGLYILTGADLRHLTVGDFWTIASALAYSLALIAIQIFSKKLQQPVLLAFYQILFIIPIAMVYIPPFNWHILLNVNVMIAILFCSIFATCIVFYLQLRYQQYTTPAKAVLIYALEPVFATLFACFIEGEKLTLSIIVGGAIIILGTVMSDIKVFLFPGK